MTTAEPPTEVRWRLATPADLPFVYRLVTQVDPRWYRFSRHGLEPSGMIGLMGGIAAGAIVHDSLDEPVACALLADSSASGTGTFEYYALPTPHAQRCAALAAPDLLGAVFATSSPRRLYVERFDNDPHLLGDAEQLLTPEVVLPDFIRIDGVYEARTTMVLTADAWWPWHEARSESAE
ncbi:MAG: hypothetical protein Q8M22_04405 [Actinomycetota bacterium]|nr:hypothetical protein [Actinomycetota bacterium]